MKLNAYFCITMKNKHLTSVQRYNIQVLLQEKTAIKRIAELLNVHQSTIYREIKRNKAPRGQYKAPRAIMLTDERKERFRRKRKLTPSMEKFIREKISQEQWSPQQIVGYCRINDIEMVSHQRIYQLIYEDKKAGGILWKSTRHKLKHRKRPISGKQVNIKNKVSIEQRPAVVDEKSRYGDWEIDTIVGKDQKGAIVTITERKSGFLLMKKLPFGKQAIPLAKTVTNLLGAYKNETHTITSDNGAEFAAHEMIAKSLKIDFYFAHPYSSWERGLNENTNKLIRQYIIKGSDFDLYDDEFIMQIQRKINRRPRKNLGFLTPTKVFFASL